MPDNFGTILVVDDEEINRTLLSVNLTELGYTVETAENGKTALEMVAAKMPDLILLDILMPEIDGFEFLHRLTARPEHRDIPVIVVSAANDAENVVRCIQMGAEDHLPKPFEPVILRARVNTCIEKKRLRDREKELRRQEINRAMEAGRAQLSAMVLHNIGNAVTPIRVQLDRIQSDPTASSVEYIEKCITELSSHQHDLQHFIRYDDRGRQIFNYLQTLVAALKAEKITRLEQFARMDQGLTYISEILSLQQSYAAAEQENRKRLDINELIDDALHMQAGALEQRGIQVEKVLAPTLPGIIIDKNRLMQAIVNIIKNAYEAIDQATQGGLEKVITIQTDAAPDETCISISDTGIGVEGDGIKKLFEFGSSSKGSSGFGLYYCRMFVEANRGSMELTSPGIGEGATVTIRFPITDRHPSE